VSESGGRRTFGVQISVRHTYAMPLYSRAVYVERCYEAETATPGQVTNGAHLAFSRWTEHPYTNYDAMKRECNLSPILMNRVDALCWTQMIRALLWDGNVRAVMSLLASSSYHVDLVRGLIRGGVACMRVTTGLGLAVDEKGWDSRWDPELARSQAESGHYDEGKLAHICCVHPHRKDNAKASAFFSVQLVNERKRLVHFTIEESTLGKYAMYEAGGLIMGIQQHDTMPGWFLVHCGRKEVPLNTGLVLPAIVYVPYDYPDMFIRNTGFRFICDEGINHGYKDFVLRIPLNSEGEVTKLPSIVHSDGMQVGEYKMSIETNIPVFTRIDSQPVRRF
jgi:hypothetical protein